MIQKKPFPARQEPFGVQKDKTLVMLDINKYLSKQHSKRCKENKTYCAVD